MKTKLFLFVIFFGVLLRAHGVSGQTITTDLKVSGNCVMCKKRIESALDRKGIKKATWDPKTKNLHLVYNSSRISEQEIHQIIAAAGHDTEKVKAPDEAYADLPYCCLYRDHDAQNHPSHP
jgi:periplasmic mercuric ion binding protein